MGEAQRAYPLFFSQLRSPPALEQGECIWSKHYEVFGVGRHHFGSSEIQSKLDSEFKVTAANDAALWSLEQYYGMFRVASDWNSMSYPLFTNCSLACDYTVFSLPSFCLLKLSLGDSSCNESRAQASFPLSHLQGSIQHTKAIVFALPLMGTNCSMFYCVESWVSRQSQVKWKGCRPRVLCHQAYIPLLL